MTLRGLYGKTRRNMSPQVVMSIVFLVLLSYMVLVPLVVMLRETFTVR